MSHPLHIVLIEPEIAPNTGNIARTCAATGCALHLVGPMGFSVDDKQLKRAGLDYWHLLPVFLYDSSQAFFAQNEGPFHYFSTKAAQGHTEARYQPGDYLVFGPESRGLPEPLLLENRTRTLRIPMRTAARSLNLSSSVAVAVYEALRQLDFPGLAKGGVLFEEF
ncbi:MAG: tRNA (cytidine(34)-2'-O)-methyltransferase [Clostridiales bacterium]|nr:tRNA (cytidine(34)-2'-O)-methyltransferase [Clostridiales bacterium]